MKRLLALLLCACLAGGAARAEEPVRLLVGLAPGSAVDQMGRLLADGLAAELGRAIVVENRTGARGNVAAEALARANPDGSVLGVVSAATLVLNRHLSRRMGYDPQADLTPISRFAAQPFLVLVPPRDGPRDLGEFVEELKGKTGTCGTPGAGTQAHLVLDMLLRSVGARCDLVHYRNSASAIPDLLDGSLQVYVGSAVIGLPWVQEGRARLLAVTSRVRSTLFPEAPTVGETVPGFEAETWIALMGPRGMEEALVARIEAAAIAVARDVAVVNRLRAMFAEPVGEGRTELAATIRAQDSIWGPVARAAGVTAD
ncbi:Bug family tripartite tricarboxylate transporter substrate binding protein [Sabulicella glaciei]|uniref:Tripartite tricarboxylate transporter substrate binding protein n=1 Tax=Sabulicella glaciei TaxID=2984948 RepID=A0ABT3P116_9PROT|nr:tripartite tricarboxylate transporter substrate binding protein [Roseococcus sp. MDT2-1-1]